MIRLKGMTWDHDRGYKPLVAVSEKFKDIYPNVEIEWDKRSLQAFADRPLDVIAEEYDFMVIDHPHIGEASLKGSIISLSDEHHKKHMNDLNAESVGPSQRSYHLNGQQWALAIDAACQVSCYRPDLISAPPKNWEEVAELAKQGKVLWPLKPVDAIDSFLTMCASIGKPAAETHTKFVDFDVAIKVLKLMKKVNQYLPKENLTHNPIDVLEIMSTSDQYAYCPLLFGYTNYSRQHYRKNIIQFCDMPEFDGQGIQGSIIGGTGIAISSKCQHQEIAKKFAYFVASAEIQKTIYFEADGQPANKVAWKDKQTNQASSNFFSSTFTTIENSWLRPRYNGFLYMADQGGDLINQFLANKLTMDQVINGLEEAYKKSLLGDNKHKYQ